MLLSGCVIDTQFPSSLTYEPFYGLHEKPFSLAADPRFLFRSPAHGPAFQEIFSGIRRREGLIVLTGEIGTGKTTLCRSVLQHLDRRTFAAFVADPFLSREDLLKTLLVDFGVISVADVTSGRFTGASRSDLCFPLYEFLDSLVPLQAFAVLVIDEAQNLSLPLLEEIRILSELERREKLLQVVLVGQPELRESLKLPQMRQVDQRVSVRCELHPLDAASVSGYVSHRLVVAGHGLQAVEFTTDALDALYLGSSGVPRLINRICDRALQHAHGARTRQLDSRYILAACADLGLAVPQVAREEPPLPAATVRTDPDAPLDIKFGGDLNFGDVLPPVEEDVVAPTPGQRAPAGRHWPRAVAAWGLAATASLGAFAWYARTQAADAAALTQAATPQPATEAVALVPEPPPTVAHASQRETSEPAPPATAPALSDASAAKPPQGTSGTSPRGTFSILVASFKRAEKAASVVDELTSAGFSAHVLERDGGPDRGRFQLVIVNGYTSAIDVQRDLQRIRALSGGYADARIVDHQ